MTFAALLLSAVMTASASPLGRAIDGTMVDVDAEPAAVVFWSADCGCGAQLAELAASGVDLVAVNTDAAADAARLRTFARRYDLSAPIISDADGDLQRRFQIAAGVVLVDADGHAVAKRSGAPLQAIALLDESTPAQGLAVAR